jgi:hypothetical protein
MSRQKLLQQMIGMMLVMLLLVGCGAPAATSVPPTATPVPPTPTPVPPTATPTPAGPRPQPGATLTGDIENSEAVEGGTINLMLSEDGTSISQMDVTFQSVRCPIGPTSVQYINDVRLPFDGPYPIIEGNIDASLDEGGELKGRFASPTEASGTIRIILTFSVSGKSTTCDFGTLNWSATVK